MPGERFEFSENKQSPQAEASGKASLEANHQSNWLSQNVLNPIVTSLAIEPLGVVSNGIDMLAGKEAKNAWLQEKREEFKYSQAETPSWEMLAQTLSIGLASALTYSAAGKLVGTTMRLGAKTATMATRLAGLEKGLVKLAGSENLIKAGNAVCNDRVAQVLGAVGFDYLRDTKESETRHGNAAGALVGFSIFESLNHKTGKMKLLPQLASLFTIGTAGGAAQHATAEMVSKGKVLTAEEVGQTMLSSAMTGGFMNMALPFAQRAIGKGMYKLNEKFGNETNYLSDHVRHYNLDEKLEVKEAAGKVSPFTLVRVQKGPTHVDYKRNTINLNKNSKSEAKEVLHEVGHLEAAQSSNYKEHIEKAVGEVQNGNVEKAWQHYAEARLVSEKHAMGREGKSVSRADVLLAQAGNGKTYGENYRKDFEEFAKSGGKELPAKDYLPAKLRKVELKNKNGEVTFRGKFTSVKEAVETAVREKVSLEKIVLTGENLAGAKLDGANFNWAEIEGANFEGVSLKKADFRGAKAKNANFKGIESEGASYESAEMEGADFEGASLKKANFYRVKATGAKFRGIDAEGANFEEALLEKADFEQASLKEAEFMRAKAKGAKFKGIEAESAYFNRAELEGADFEDASLKKACFYRVKAKDASFRGIDADDAAFGRAGIEGAEIEGADFEGASLKKADFYRAKARGASFREIEAEGAFFEEAQLEEADFEGANLDNANIHTANLKGANLKGVGKIGKIKGLDETNVEIDQIDLEANGLGEVDWRPKESIDEDYYAK